MSLDAKKHAQEVSELWSAYGRRENKRVPIAFATDEQTWLKISGDTFWDFYMIPEIHLKAQLEGKAWFINSVMGDMSPLLPEKWYIGLQLWMEENEFFGCEVIYQENDYAWALPLKKSKDDLLSHIADIDPDECIRKSHAYKMYQSLKEISEGMTFEDRPIEIVRPGQGTHGIFTKAVEIRGIEQICIDMYDDPDFVEKYLHLITEKTIERIRAWHRLVCGSEIQLPMESGWGCADDSLQLLSAELYERFVLPCHEFLYSNMTKSSRSMHLCGLASQHFKILKQKLGIKAIDGPGPFVDHGYFLRELGTDFSFSAQTDHSVLAMGSRTEIDDMMRKMLNPGAKIPGRFSIMGFLNRDTPVENLQYCYEAGKRYGAIDDSEETK